MTRQLKPLWTCPKCGRQFATENLWHSCTSYTLDHHFAGKDPHLRTLFDAYLAFVERCGPVTVISQKTRIAIMMRVRFTGVVVRKHSLVCYLWLKRQVGSPRFDRVEKLPPHNYICTFRLSDAAELDDALFAFVQESYDVGCQRHLDPSVVEC